MAHRGEPERVLQLLQPPAPGRLTAIGVTENPAELPGDRHRVNQRPVQVERQDPVRLAWLSHHCSPPPFQVPVGDQRRADLTPRVGRSPCKWCYAALIGDEAFPIGLFPLPAQRVGPGGDPRVGVLGVGDVSGFGALQEPDVLTAEARRGEERSARLPGE